jgi:hypothetical protein
MASILNEVKKACGLAPDYTAFDVDMIMHINAVFTVLDQLGIGPEGGFFISDSTQDWDTFAAPDNQKNLTKSYMYLKVRFIFDPPPTSFAINAMKGQIEEFEWRLKDLREVALAEEVIP